MGGMCLDRLSSQELRTGRECLGTGTEGRMPLMEAKVQLGLEGHARIRRSFTFIVNFRCTEMVSGAPSDSGWVSTHQG